MRADRLLSLLTTLQARGKCTARELAAELEVSVRTVYRDVEALSAAGIPIWAEGGPGGGCQLMEGWRTPLLGISADEAMALLAAAAPAPLEATSLADDLAAARLKLLAALPAARRAGIAAESARFHVDAPGWFRPVRPAPHLETLVRSVRSERRLRLEYARAPGRVEVEPLGLVAKAGRWYLVAQAQDRLAVYRVDRVVSAEVLTECFDRPLSFDLAAFWANWSREFEASRLAVLVNVRIHPRLWDSLPEIFGDGVHGRMEASLPSHRDGWRLIELTFESVAAARTRILGLGAEAEVVEPQEIREAVRAAAAGMTKLYARAEAATGASL